MEMGSLSNREREPMVEILYCIGTAAEIPLTQFSGQLGQKYLVLKFPSLISRLPIGKNKGVLST